MFSILRRKVARLVGNKPSRKVSPYLSFLRLFGTLARFTNLSLLEFSDGVYAWDRLLDHIDDNRFDRGGAWRLHRPSSFPRNLLHPSVCLLDPYGLHLDWEVVFLAGQSQAIDMFLNFPVMDMNRNAIWRNPKGVPQDGIERMTRFWGDESWKKVAYLESAQGDLFLDPPLVKQDNDAIVSAFQDRLKNVAGFKYVLNPLPMKNSNNTVVYYLFLASQKAVAEKIIRDIFAKYR